MKRILISSAFIALFFLDMKAQDFKSILSDTLNINEVVITGTKTAVNRNNVPVTVTVVSQAKIESSAESALLPVLSEQVPGLFVTERGITGFGVSAGAAGQIILRGLGGSPNTQVLVLVDGNPQFMGLMGHPLPDAYISSDVEKVEVIRGPASTLYGTNAMGGVINIITREQKENGFSGNSRIMYGSFDTRKYMVNGGYKKDGFNILASINHDRTDGHRDSSDFRITNGYLKTGYKFNGHFKITGDMSLAGFNAIDPGMVDVSAGNSYDITRGMAAAVFDNTFSKSSGSVRFFYNFGEHKISDGFHSKDKNYGIVIYQSFNLVRGNTLTLGLDRKKYGGIAENVLAMSGNGIVLGDTTVNEMAGYINIQQEFFEKVTLNAGFRYEHSSVTGGEPVPAVGMSFRPSSATIVKASLSKGFRNPAIRELYLFAPANGDLRPERMVNYEASLLQRLHGGKISVEITLYKAKGNNLIQTVMTERGPRNMNTGRFSNAGFEFSGNYRTGRNLTVNSTYSYISMKYPVLAAPKHHFNLGTMYQLNSFGFNLSIQHINDLYTRITNTGKAKESYTLLKAGATYTFNKNIGIFIRGENLTNQKYQINYGYPMPGFIMFAGINLQIRS